MATGPDPSFQLCSTFVVASASPHHFNILFWDRGIIDEAQPLAAKLMEQWNEFLKDKLPTVGSDTNVDFLKFRVDAYEEFARTSKHVNTYTALQEMFYWHPGRYFIQLEVATIHPDKKFIKKWEFRLAEQDSNLLKLNIVNVLREICTVTAFPYNFSYAKYEIAPNA